MADRTLGQSSTPRGRFEPELVLKSDTFSTIERGTYVGADGTRLPAVRRLFGEVAWWVKPIANHFAWREATALKAAKGLNAGPELIDSGDGFLVRSFIEGLPLHLARPTDPAWFRNAKRMLHALHRAGVVHNDLAKEQNWLVGPEGEAVLTDFQLAMVFPRRSKLFRVLAHEDLRHLLKHKRRYCPQALTASERRMLGRKSLPARLWLMTGKKVYNAITRGLLRYEDREGGGKRLANDGPLILAWLKRHPQVRDAFVAAYPFPRRGCGLYAFVEAPGLDAETIRGFIVQEMGCDQAPELLQVVERLPRHPDGSVHEEVLRLVALNQIDLVATLPETEEARAATRRIVAGRLNLADRT
ncbi:AMP-binding enzyme [Blastochloris tepida]|uniref:AMP-binding enzyme n=1 Tax=Blastochloris tepida TaxID=2233851 RepID=UPI0015802668|nr:serine/threonine protein kinase [Blastochloris tepida]